ncbi:superoxide dismutase [Candidatus Dependentiae bacterium]|nr:superoxide dismutase [Candidatus Dependentiae bacterium]
MKLNWLLILLYLIFLPSCNNKIENFKDSQNIYDLKYPFSLPNLGYDYDALEPHIDALTMKIHHTKHHQAYIDKLNELLKNNPEYQQKTLKELLENIEDLPKDVRQEIINQGGGHLNHSLFWTYMSPNGGGKPSGKLLEDIEKSFNSFEKFKEKFNGEAKKKFGSGWAWLVLDHDGSLQVMSTSNQDSPIEQGLEPILGLDVWEHAYYLKYQNKRPDYIVAWWDVVDWPNIEKNYEKIISMR